MSTAVRPKTFGTSGSYPAGTDDWSGQPRVVDLTDGERADGFTPDTPVPAEVLNGLHAEHYSAQGLLAHRALTEWTVIELNPVNEVYGLLAAVRLPSPFGEHALVAMGYDPTDTNDARFNRSLGTNFETLSFDPARTEGPVVMAAGAREEFWWSECNVASVVSRTRLGGVQTVETAAITGQPVAMFYDDYSSKYFIATDTGNLQMGATIPTIADSPFPPAVTAIGTANQLCTPGGEYAGDGAGHIVLACQCTIGGVSVFRILNTDTGGTTWTVAKTYGAGLTSVNVVWVPDYGSFMALASDGSIHTSPDGSAWTAKATVASISAASGAVDKHCTMAALGGCVVKAYQPVGAGGLMTYKGVAYSFDLGMTWYHSPFAKIGTSADLKAVVVGNGRFYVSDSSRVYASGRLSYETTNDF